MDNEAFLPHEILGHGAYLCLRWSGDAAGRGGADVTSLAERLGLRNEFDPGGPPPRDSIAYLRRVGGAAGDIPDDGVLQADAVLHVASPRADAVATFCAEATDRLRAVAHARVLRGVVRPKAYTGAAMNNWAYARAIVQQPGSAMPNAFLFPLSKTPEWWRKDWLERHTYFLPRYDESGKMLSEGHALASAAGIAALLRRTYKHEREQAPAGEYDFLTYFECSDANVPVFHEVCATLRDAAKNPEWRFVREGPIWHGRRLASWKDLIAV